MIRHKDQVSSRLRKIFGLLNKLLFPTLDEAAGVKSPQNPTSSVDKTNRCLNDLEPLSVLDCYRILGLFQDRPSGEQVKAAYRKLIWEYHPDKVETKSECIKKDAHVKSRKINGAYELLKKNGLVELESEDA